MLYVACVLWGLIRKYLYKEYTRNSLAKSTSFMKAMSMESLAERWSSLSKAKATLWQQKV